jgi:phospholipid/cholesterol/gamma-HCH transport system substrate-binding protein
VLPTFLRESRLTLDRLDRFAAESDPVVTQLRPAARELGPTIVATTDLAGELDLLWPGLRRVIDKADSGFSALRGLLDDQLPPLLGRLDPFLDELTPIFTAVRNYRREVTGFLGNATAVTNASNDEGSGQRNYLRTLASFSPEMLAAYPRRLRIDRTNPYFAPGAYKLKGGLKSFSTGHCADGINAILDPNAAADPDFNARTGGDPAQAQDLLGRLSEFVFLDRPDSNSVPAPPCVDQAPFQSIGVPEETTDYQHVNPLP